MRLTASRRRENCRVIATGRPRATTEATVFSGLSRVQSTQGINRRLTRVMYAGYPS